MQDFLGFILPVVVAALTTVIAEQLQRVSALVDSLPAIVKQIAVAAIAFGLTRAAAAMGVTIGSTELAGLSQADISALASAALAYVFHLGAKAKTA